MPPSLVKNTLLSAPFLARISSLPTSSEQAASLANIVRDFGAMKGFAGEIQTELHLVKPILKILGYAFESKPKFFEDHIKGADFALFESEEKRAKSTRLWGTKAYYENVLALLQVKRYGRNLEEGICGFYLEFENRMPLYQSIYLSKKAETPWGILTNGKNWLLLKRPAVFEKRIIEVDLEAAVSNGDERMLQLFCHIFSSVGLTTLVPDLLDEERTSAIALLKGKKFAVARALQDSTHSRSELLAASTRLYNELEPYQDVLETGGSTMPLKPYDQSDIFSYIFTAGTEAVPSFEQIILEAVKIEPTKEQLLSLKILDMTPGFGNVAVKLVETLTYLSFLLPYKEKHTFVAEWEHERLLNRFITSNVVYGVEKYEVSLNVLQNGLLARFNSPGVNYRLGNPLLGVSLNEVHGPIDEKKEAGLFSTGPADAITEFRDTYRLFSSLSDRIKEDAVLKRQLEEKLRTYQERFRDVMNIITAAYFDHALENKKTRELLYYMDGDEAMWDAARKNAWFSRCQEIAHKKLFFHMEVEFPFLLNNRFDLIVIQPAIHYLWEDTLPPNELTKAYIKRAITYLKQTGKLILVGTEPDEMVADLKRSRKYVTEVQEGAVTIRRR